jgi:TolB protein
LIAALGLLVALVSVLLVGDARSAREGSELIAFTRADGIYVIRPDGTGLHPLWQGKRTPTELTWSPDGRKLAFGASARWGTSGGGIWVMNADGSDPVRVASVPAESLTWSPDGRRIAFTAKGDIWLMNADGSNIRPLRRTPRLFERNVDWRPTGGWVAFDSGGYVPFVYVMRTNGRNLRKLPPPTLRGWPDSTDPDWSPDGRRIVFASVVGSSDSMQIWVMNASGKQWVQLTRNRVPSGSPAWSPDGRKIALLRGDWAKDRSWEIYVMQADGTGVTRLTNNRVRDGSPAWQPVAVP